VRAAAKEALARDALISKSMRVFQRVEDTEDVRQ
jgi:hypothetical protein